ncbi:MAG: phosphoribosylformylglycinamidine synthase subunit PurL [Actinobacteria bacterium]|nr:phosphoribosylformylglycinamidine synthase subunit PurL [Actinomycetota bacterium]
MNWRVEVSTRKDFPDTHGQALLSQINDLGITTVQALRFIRVFLIQAEADRQAMTTAAAELLSDPVTEDFYLGQSKPPPGLAKATTIEVHLKPGVTDPVAGSTLMALRDMGIKADSVRTARKYVMLGNVTDVELQNIAAGVLANDCIETVLFDPSGEPPSPDLAPYQLEVITVPIHELSDDELTKLSRDRDLFLNLREMQTIQEHFKQLGRDPSDLEIETLAQTWSEHCVHKTLRGVIEFNGQTIDNLLGSTIMKATRDLNKPWCISVFKDNAGVIRFDDAHAVCFKVETHNHPSAIEPYGGAATGIGGVIRDPLGTGLGARPIANTDIFCFAPPDMPREEIPKGVLHPARVLRGVVGGVRDYGNRMGIPTVNGAVYFDERYLGNPLVYCGNVGLLPIDGCFGEAQPGDKIIVAGGRTGRDGIHGATFSSGELTHSSDTEFSHAVQIGNAITEKKLADTIIQARDEGLYSAITDCGAGGLSSAVGEMGQELGADVELEKVPLKYEGLSYTEIWISEAQERMVIAVPPENLERVMEIFTGEDVEATCLGEFTNDHILRVRYQGTVVGELQMEFLHDGVPRYTRRASWTVPELSEPNLPESPDLGQALHDILAAPNVASKEWIIRQYDHEVQGGSAIKPLVGVANDGPGDAAVVRPLLDSDRGLAISCGMNPKYSDLDPYYMALAGVDEAIRNAICVGADLSQLALLDNFCWGNPDVPERLGSLVLASQACYDAAMAFGTPFISGKDSLNNEFARDDGTTIAIPATLLISAIAIVPDTTKCVTMDLKSPGNHLFLMGITKNELGGSHYYALSDQLGANVPQVDLSTAPAVHQAVAKAIEAGLVASCHDLSEGGLAVAAAEMAFAGGLGAKLDLAGVPLAPGVAQPEQILFSESQSRYLLEVRPEHYNDFISTVLPCHVGQVGLVTAKPSLIVVGARKNTLIDEPIEALKESWQRTLRW